MVGVECLKAVRLRPVASFRPRVLGVAVLKFKGGKGGLQNLRA